MALGREPRPPRLVILRALGIGDLLTAVPALRALARAFPGHERVLAAPAALRPLVELVSAGEEPAVHSMIDARALEPLPRSARGAEIAVNLHGRGPESHRVVRAARPGRALWFENPEVAESRGAPRWHAGEHEVARWCRMLSESGVPCRPHELELELVDVTPSGATVIHPGAGSAARRWLPFRFAAVARAEAERGHPVMITGASEDIGRARSIALHAGLPEASVVAGRTDLGALARIIAGAGRVVCGDTGVGHLATAFGIPSVVLFGPTSPAEWGPPAGRPRHRVLWAGETGDPHGGRPDPGLLAIQVADVVRALAELPAREADPAPA